MLTLNIAQLCKMRGINRPLPTLTKAGISRTVAHDYISGNRSTILLKHIEVFCQLFNCLPQDLFVWTPDNATDDKPDNPLQVIRKKDLPDITAAIKKMTVQELRAFALKSENV